MPASGGPKGRKKGISRRELFGLAGAAGAGIALGAGGMGALALEERAGEQTHPFCGFHQSGVATPSQARLHFAAFDATAEDLEGVRDLLRAWSEAAAKMCAGEPVGDVGG